MPPPARRTVLRCVGPVRRLNLTLLVVAFVMSVLAARLVQLQGMDSAGYATAAANLWMKTVPIPAVRGSITSSDGAVLAMTVQTDLVFADPPQIPARLRAQVAAQLAGPLGQPAATILAEIDHPSSAEYQVLAPSVSQATWNHIASLNLPGIASTPQSAPSYPDGNLAADVVGYDQLCSQVSSVCPKSEVGDLVGHAGLEQEYNQLLSGRNGSEKVEVDGAAGQPIALTEAKSTAPVPAENLRLTINSNIQFAAEQECRQKVTKYHARNCTIIVMQPHTGAILAMAQWPTYNPAQSIDPSDPNTANLSTTNVFAPGSTLKSITVAAALEKGGQTPMSPYTIPYEIRVGPHDVYPFHDAEFHPTVRYTIAGILAHSSNVGMVQVVQHITPEQQYSYLRAFGLGSYSGLGIPGESQGLVPSPGSPDYYGDSPYEYSFGQGVSVTAIQMASVYATIANGGVRVQPTLIAGTTNSAGSYKPAPRPASRRVIQPKTAHELMTMLQQVPVVDSQAGEPYGILQGYPVAAKTGTAQVSDPSVATCALCQYGASYIGIAPANNPQLVVAVNIQDPQGHNYFGDEVAGPAFYDVMRFALQTMKIPPDYARTPNIRLTAP
jgi:cell division protein FtsI (penicillin-binding protein 3)